MLNKSVKMCFFFLVRPKMPVHKSATKPIILYDNESIVTTIKTTANAMNEEVAEMVGSVLQNMGRIISKKTCKKCFQEKREKTKTNNG